MKAFMLSSYVLGILVAGALSMGCVAQAGTDEGSQGEGLTADQNEPTQQIVQQQAATTKQRVQITPGTTVAQPVAHAGLPETQLEGLAGTDPSGNGNGQDDGDGKEPDPHPWHTNTATLAGH